jgi:hypothetical protein
MQITPSAPVFPKLAKPGPVTLAVAGQPIAAARPPGKRIN